MCVAGPECGGTALRHCGAPLTAARAFFLQNFGTTVMRGTLVADSLRSRGHQAEVLPVHTLLREPIDAPVDVCICIKFCSRAVVERCHSLGARVYWDLIDRITTMDEIVDSGVDCVIVNNHYQWTRVKATGYSCVYVVAAQGAMSRGRSANVRLTTAARLPPLAHPRSAVIGHMHTNSDNNIVHPDPRRPVRLIGLLNTEGQMPPPAFVEKLRDSVSALGADVRVFIVEDAFKLQLSGGQRSDAYGQSKHVRIRVRVAA